MWEYCRTHTGENTNNNMYIFARRGSIAPPAFTPAQPWLCDKSCAVTVPSAAANISAVRKSVELTGSEVSLEGK